MEHSTADETSALSALYQAERSDWGSLQTANISIVALVVAYAGATIAFLNADAFRNVEPIAIAFIPLPAWVTAVFLTILSSVQGRRTVSVMILERRLKDITPLRAEEREAVGLAASEKVYDIWRTGIVRLSLGVVFASSVIALVAYTVLMVTQSIRANNQSPHPTNSAILWIMPGVVYTAFLSIAAWTAVAHELSRLSLARQSGIQ